MEKLLTPEEVADILAISVFTIKDYLRAGKITGVKIGKKWRVSPSALQEFIDENTRTKPEKEISLRERIINSDIEPITFDEVAEQGRQLLNSKQTEIEDKQIKKKE